MNQIHSTEPVERAEGSMRSMGIVTVLDVFEHSTERNIRVGGTNRRLKRIGGVWRIAFTFDLERKAIILVAGGKSGIGERRFYQQLIGKADHRCDSHLDRLKAERRTRR